MAFGLGRRARSDDEEHLRTRRGHPQPVLPRKELLRAIVIFVAASVVIGFLLDMLAITPLDLWREIWAWLESAASFLWAQSSRLLRWFLLGAVIVGPILLMRLVLRARR